MRIFGSFDQAIAQIKAELRAGEAVADHVLFGPVVERPGGARTVSPFYFVVATADQGQARLVAIGAETKARALRMREALFVAMLDEPTPLMLHDFDTELALVGLASALWPDEMIKRIHNELLAETWGPALGRA
jgi:hypothetical protein